MNHLERRRVVCRRCRFTFEVEIPFAATPTAPDAWTVEAQCPCCEIQASFTAADMPGHALPVDPEVHDRSARQFHQEALVVITEHDTHPSVQWFEKIGSGIFIDDITEWAWPIGPPVYRFRRGADVAYIWQKDASWCVRAWAGLDTGPELLQVGEARNFASALDALADLESLEHCTSMVPAMRQGLDTWVTAYLTDDGQVPLDYFAIYDHLIYHWDPDFVDSTVMPPTCGSLMSVLIEEHFRLSQSMQFLIRQGRWCDTWQKLDELAKRYQWPNWRGTP